MKRWAAIAFVVVAALPYLAMLRSGSSLSAPTPVAATDTDTLRIISPHRPEVKAEYSRAFGDYMQREYGRRVAVHWVDVGGTSKILKELETRYASTPDRPGLDLFFGGGVPHFLVCVQHGWLQPAGLPASVTSRLPSTCAGVPVYDPAGRWFGVALSSFGIIYNRPVLDRLQLPVLREWADLGKPEYYSWLGSGDPRSSGSVHACYEIILQAYGLEKGWALITRLCANVRSFGEGGGVVPREVASGEIAAGMVIDQYAKTVIDAVGGSDLVLVLPEGLTVVSPDPIGLLTHAPNPELARLFMQFVLSPEGQQILYQLQGTGGQQASLFRMPVLPEAYESNQALLRVNPYRFRGALKYDEDLASRRAEIMKDLMGSFLIDAHPELTAAWRAVIARGMQPDDVARLCELPVDEAELMRLAGVWNDAALRADTRRRWAGMARERYVCIQGGRQE